MRVLYSEQSLVLNGCERNPELQAEILNHMEGAHVGVDVVGGRRNVFYCDSLGPSGISQSDSLTGRQIGKECDVTGRHLTVLTMYFHTVSAFNVSLQTNTPWPASFWLSIQIEPFKVSK